MRKCTRVFVALAWLALVPAAAYAQASIAGVVKDTSGAVLPGVHVEASSDALIEKVRVAVTDTSGQYRIIDLRPGSYIVTFTLSGFSTAKREGLQLEGAFNATVNVELNVGTVAETVTVIGEPPLVDTQSAKRQMTVSNETLNALPTARAYAAYALLIPGITVGNAASNIQSTPGMVVFAGVGGRSTEGRMQVDGLNVGLGGSVSLYNADISNASELAITTSGALGEQEVSAPVINVVPKTGGNTVKGSIYGSGTPESWVGSNYTDDLKNAGLPAIGKFVRIWDYNAGVGGPIKRDRVWFFGNIRFEGARQLVPGVFGNMNGGDPSKFLVAPDPTKQAQFANSYSIGSLRITAQVTPRNKINVFWDEQIPCNGGGWSNEDGCRGLADNGTLYTGGFGPNASLSPEASTYNSGHQRVQQANWSSPLTNRLFLEAAFGDFINNWGQFGRPGSPIDGLIPVTELCIGSLGGCPTNGGRFLTYRSPVGGLSPVDYYFGNYSWRGSASFVTGAHSMKFGYNGYLQTQNVLLSGSTEFGGNLRYSFQNGAPFQLSQDLRTTNTMDRVRYDAFYAQDQWSLGRLTLQGGLRYDHLWSFYPDQQLGPTRFLPAPILFPSDQYAGVNFHDVSPRAGAAFDVFGNGKTSFKVNLGRYLETGAVGGIYTANNPMARLAGGTSSRTWNDLNGNFIPDCNLSVVTAQSPATTGSIDSCGALTNQFFGTSRFTNNFDSNLLNGFGVRPSDWSFGVSVQQELLPRVSVEAGYFRRWLGNYAQTRNMLVSAADFHAYSVQVPTDPRLGSDSGKVLTGLYTVDASKAGLSDATNVQASSLGDQSQHYDGFNLNVTARPRNGLTFQGGVNTGTTVQDSCDIRSKYPEIRPGPGTTPAPATSVVNPYCHIDSGFVTRVTGLGSYTVPKIDVLVSATFRSDQGQLRAANQSGLSAPAGQAFLGFATGTVNYLTPGTLYGDRVNEVDFNFSKILRFGRTRTKIGVDFYNILNVSPVLTYNNNYAPATAVGAAAWSAPLTVLTGRYAKLSAQFDF